MDIAQRDDHDEHDVGKGAGYAGFARHKGIAKQEHGYCLRAVSWSSLGHSPSDIEELECIHGAEDDGDQHQWPHEGKGDMGKPEPARSLVHLSCLVEVFWNGGNTGETEQKHEW